MPQLVVVNGLDYDHWASDAVDAVASSLPTVDAGEIVGRAEGDNPHLWYDPDAVRAVADAVTARAEARCRRSCAPTSTRGHGRGPRR